MDPSAIGSEQWSDIGALLTNLCNVVGLIVFFATNIMIGHIFIPSLVASHHIPSGLQRTRPVFYAVGVVSFVAALVLVASVVEQAGVLRDFWEDYWI